MDTPSTYEYEYELDIFGQQSGLHNLYTQISLIYALPAFSLAEDAVIPKLEETLTRGLSKLTDAIPWIAGQVVQDPPQSGIYKIVALDAIPQLTIKDLRGSSSILTLPALRSADYPFSMLDENVMAPRNTLMAAGATCPVFMVQATLIEGGGLVLTFVGVHNVMDMTGFGWVVGLLDRVCRVGEGGEVTEEERRLGNVDRRGVVPLLDVRDGWVPGDELARQIVRRDVVTSLSTETEKSSPFSPKCTWVYVIFPPESLVALKTLASGPGFVSTDDVLSAFIFQSIVRARVPRLSLWPPAPVTFARAIDPRRFLSILQTYAGVVQNMTYHSYFTSQGLINTALGTIASDLRAALLPQPSNPTADIGYRTRALATHLSRASDKNTISVTATLDLARDVMLSSWAKESGLWEVQFGLGCGVPEAVRRPAFVGVESLCYVMPRRKDGGEAVVGLCLREEDMERFRADDEVRRWARWVG